jgi:hypothetical protein
MEQICFFNKITFYRLVQLMFNNLFDKIRYYFIGQKANQNPDIILEFHDDVRAKISILLLTAQIKNEDISPKKIALLFRIASTTINLNCPEILRKYWTEYELIEFLVQEVGYNRDFAEKIAIEERRLLSLSRHLYIDATETQTLKMDLVLLNEIDTKTPS